MTGGKTPLCLFHRRPEGVDPDQQATLEETPSTPSRRRTLTLSTTYSSATGREQSSSGRNTPMPISLSAVSTMPTLLHEPPPPPMSLSVCLDPCVRCFESDVPN